MTQINQGDILVNPQGDKRKVLAVCGEVYAISEMYDLDVLWNWCTQKGLDNKSWKVEQQKWKPEPSECYFYVDSGGDIIKSYWNDDEEDAWRLKVGGVHRIIQHAESYKAKLVAWGGKQ